MATVQHDQALSARESDPLYVPLNRLALNGNARLYAVMDGAMFEGLPGELSSRNISARSLYRADAHASWIESGPWLIDPYRLADGRDEEDDEEDDGYSAAALPDNDVEAGEEELSDEDLEDQADDLARRMQAALEAGDETGGGLLPSDNPDPADPRPFAKPVYPWPQIRALIELADGSPGLVFWIGDQSLTEPQLYRHLRTINRVLIPSGYRRDKNKPADDAKTTNAFGEVPNAVAVPDAQEGVLFRHADGNVLAEVLPVLDEVQFARLFGPARDLIFIAPDHPASDGSILYEAPLPDDAPPPKAGLLEFSIEQMKAIEGGRTRLLKNRISTYLKENTGENLGGVTDKEISKAVERSWSSAQELGINSLENRKKWAWLDLASDGQLARNADIRKHLQRNGADHSWDMDNLVALSKEKLQSKGKDA